MKYIVIRTTLGGVVRELPFIFPNCIIHEDAFKMMSEAIKLSTGEKAGECVAVSAGETSCMKPGSDCHGDSETLRIKSRGDVDDSLIYSLDYSHGIV